MTDDINKIKKEAYKCFNNCKGNCPSSYDTSDKVCLYCLEYILRRPNPNKKEMQDITLKEIFDKVDKEKPNNKIKKSRTKTKTFSFPIALIEFPLSKKDKNPKEIHIYKQKPFLVEKLKSLYGSYEILTHRQYKPMDLKVFLTSLYFTNQHKSRIFENKFKTWLDLLDVKDTGFYRKAIIKGLEFLTNSTLYHYHAWNYEKRVRETLKKGDRLPSFSMFHILNEFHHLTEKDKRKSKLMVEIGETFYKKIQERSTYIELEKVIPLSDISFNLYMFLKMQYDKRTFVNIPYPFEDLKNHIGITDTNSVRAKRTFDNAFKDLKDRGLIKEYDYKIKLLDGKEVIRFKFIKSLKP